MSAAVAIRESQEAELIERLVIDGDIGKLGPADRLTYYYAMCRRAGLDPLSQPLEYLKLNGKTVLYFKRASTDQIASNRKLSRRIVRAEMVGNVYLVVAECSDASGRVEQSTGAVSTQGLGGEALVNAMLKAESKAKRRSVLSFTGMGFMDEGEAESIPGAVRLDIAAAHGTTVNAPPDAEPAKPAGPLATDPMPEEWRGGLFEFTKKLHSLTGALTEIPNELTRKEARALIASLKEQIAAAEAAQEPEPELAGV